MVLLNQSSALKAAAATAAPSTSAQGPAPAPNPAFQDQPVVAAESGMDTQTKLKNAGPLVAMPALAAVAPTMEHIAEELQSALAREKELAKSVKRGFKLAKLLHEVAACRTVLAAAEEATAAAVDAIYAADANVDADEALAAAAAVVPYVVLSPSALEHHLMCSGSSAISAAQTPTAMAATDSLRKRKTAVLPPPALEGWGAGVLDMTPRQSEVVLKLDTEDAEARRQSEQSNSKDTEVRRDANLSQSVEQNEQVQACP